MSEVDFDWRFQHVLTMLLTTAVVLAVALAVAIVIAVLVDMQSNYWGSRSERGGLFNPSVSPGELGAVADLNLFPIRLEILLGMLISSRIITGPEYDRLRSIDEPVVVSGRWVDQSERPRAERLARISLGRSAGGSGT